MSNFDKKIQTDVGVLDFSRAFDTVPHERLIGKLAHYGIQGNILSWIRAFLSNRQMSVVVDGESSKQAPVVSGVPQGSVLGPLLFLMYINDLPEVVSEGTSIRLFADDCLAYRKIQSANDQIILQEDLERLHQWTVLWGMRFNPSKCQIMHLSRGKKKTRYYELCKEILTTVDHAKYLGITLSDDLSWHRHICDTAKKANSILHLISRNLRSCPRAARIVAYTTLVRPKLEYSSTVWDPHTKDDINILERVNRRAARLVFNKSWKQQDVSPTALLKQLGWQQLEDRRKHQRLVMLYKIANQYVAIPPSKLVSPGRTTRGHSRKFQTIRTTCDKVKYSYFPRTIPDWNRLPDEVVTAGSVASFKRSLAAHLC